jgi:putative SOS response-associated peptidase YedK
MCAHYQGLSQPQSYTESFAVKAPTDVTRTDIWPGYEGAFIRRPLDADVADAGDEAVLPRQALKGLFGLVPHWSRDLSLAKRTYNARSETVAVKPSFRDAWRLARHCIVPLQAFFEPDWRSGRAVATRISHADGQPLGLAGLWSVWKPPQGAVVHSFTLLTINADDHPMMKNFHRPSDEKRSVVVLPPERYDDWLAASAQESSDFLRPIPAGLLRAEAPPTSSLFDPQSTFF